MLHALSWYMSARQTALRSALSFRAQLSATDQKDLRIHYSAYFLNLLAATEILRETTLLPPNHFEAQIYTRLVFSGFQNGEANYSYVRELRNSVVHRGLDITSASHFDNDFPLILAEPAVQNQSGKRTLVAFDNYLLGVIAKCESVIGIVMLDCLTAAGVFETTVDAEASATENYEAIMKSTAMPDYVKAMALNIEFKPEWVEEAHSITLMKLRAALMPCDTKGCS